MVNKIDACNTVLGYDCNVNKEQLTVWLFLKLYPSEVQYLIVSKSLHVWRHVSYVFLRYILYDIRYIKNDIDRILQRFNTKINIKLLNKDLSELHPFDSISTGQTETRYDYIAMLPMLIDKVPPESRLQKNA